MTKSINAILGFLLTVGAYALTIIILFAFVPYVSKMLDDLDVELPNLTVFIVQTRLPLAWTYSGILAALVVFSIILNHKPEKSLTINLIGLAVALITLAVIAMAFVSPSITIGASFY